MQKPETATLFWRYLSDFKASFGNHLKGEMAIKLRPVSLIIFPDAKVIPLLFLKESQPQDAPLSGGTPEMTISNLHFQRTLDI